MKLEREIKGAHVLGRRKMPNFQRWVAKGQSEGCVGSGAREAEGTL